MISLESGSSIFRNHEEVVVGLMYSCLGAKLSLKLGAKLSDRSDKGEGVIPETRSVRDAFDTCRQHPTVNQPGNRTNRLDRPFLLPCNDHTSKIITMFFIACLAASFAVARTTENASYQVFQEAIASKDASFVLFTSQTTQFLQSYTSVFERANTNSGISFLTVDCDREGDLCNEHDVNSYPTFRLFEPSKEGSNRHETRYRGPRTMQAISGWVKRKELGVITNIDEMGMEAFKEIDEIVVVAQLPSDDKTLLDCFTAVAAQQHQDYVFGYTTDPLIAKDQGLAVPSVKLFKNIDNDHRTLSGAYTSASLSSFLAIAIPSTIRTFREKDLENFMQRDKLTLYIFTSPGSSRATSLLQLLTPLAKKYEKYATFAMADAVKHAEMASKLLSRIDEHNKDQEMETSIVVHAPLNNNVFMWAHGKKMERDDVESMLKTILQGKAKSGDVFGKDAADLEEGKENAHDEL